MKTLNDATQKICQLKGTTLALECLLMAVIDSLPASARATAAQAFAQHAESARTQLLHALVSEHTIQEFERDAQRASAMLANRRD